MKSIFTIMACLLFGFSASAEDSLTSTGGMQLAYCAEWEEQCEPDIIYENKVNCTQHCVRYVSELSTVVDSRPSGPIGLRGTISGLVIIGLLIYCISYYRQ